MSRPLALTVSASFIRSVGGGARRCAALLFVSLALAACSSTESMQTAMRGYQPCTPQEVHAGGSARCEIGRNLLLAMASGREVASHDVVEQEILEEQRGGFIMAGGLKVDFGFQFQTIVNGTPQLTSVLSYSDILAGKGPIPNLNSITLTGSEEGTTQIIHSGGPTGIGATILNSQNGLNVENISTLAIDIVGLGRVHRGGAPIGNGRPMSMEVKQSIIRGLQ